jgi:hypothetical protein
MFGLLDPTFFYRPVESSLRAAYGRLPPLGHFHFQIGSVPLPVQAFHGPRIEAFHSGFSGVIGSQRPANRFAYHLEAGGCDAWYFIGHRLFSVQLLAPNLRTDLTANRAATQQALRALPWRHIGIFWCLALTFCRT